jgi:hypothetical protein
MREHKVKERLQILRDRTRNREHKTVRREQPVDILEDPDFKAMSHMKQVAHSMTLACAAETPVILPDENIVFTRTVTNLLVNGAAGNICADWGMVISQGLAGRRAVALETKEKFLDDPTAVEFLDSAVETIDAALSLADAYAKESRKQGLNEIADILAHVPANAADALAAVKKIVFDESAIESSELLESLETNFEHAPDLFALLHDHGPKVGNNDPYLDDLLKEIFDAFADACEAVNDNGRGGILRLGTGTAMYQVWLVRPESEAENFFPPRIGATADGRYASDLIGSGLAPSPGVSVRGPISVLQSFSKIDYGRICNGGPITMELSDTVFRNDETIEKVAMLVRTFAQLGCLQLQLNTLNVDKLRDAQENPDKYRNLIVRVWGWSSYFIELDRCYQDHIITRNMYAV